MPKYQVIRRSSALVALLWTSSGLAAPPLLGDHPWQLGNNGPVIAFEQCESYVCGRIIALPGGKRPRLDTRNPDPAKRDLPVCGQRVITGLMALRDEWTNGKIYLPPAGKTGSLTIKAGPRNPVATVAGVMPFGVNMDLIALSRSGRYTC